MYSSLIYVCAALQLYLLKISSAQSRSTYDDLIRENELLKEELSVLRARLRYLNSECTCPEEKVCQYEGRSYQYRAVFRGGACTRCTCEENGEVRCRYDDSISGCGDQCLSSPCYNGGTCESSRSTGYVCICPPNCTGERCEKREDIHTCSSPIDRGYACDSAQPSVIWYYEPKAGDCVQSQFLGCGGNSNRYTSYTECENSCLSGTCCVRTRLRSDTPYGHSPSGYDRYGYGGDGVNELGEKSTVKTSTAFGSLRYRFQGVDFKGYRVDGYNKDRYSLSGYNCESVDTRLLNEDSLSVGFNYSCLVSSISECLSSAATGFPDNEVIAFSTGDTECNVSPCHRADHTQCRGCHYNGGFYSYEQVFSNGCNECICTRTGSVQCTCTKTVKRKEIRDMTADEISDYQRAVRKLYSLGNWTDLSVMYESYLPHSHNQYFLAWHRAMLNHIELALQQAARSCDIAIPYFDWTMDSGMMTSSPAWRAGLFGGDGDEDTHCVENHPFSDYPWSPCLRRQFNTSITLPDPVMIENIRRVRDINSLNQQLSTVSLLFRSWLGGNAAGTNAIYDPIVLSHYAFIDKIWHEWQQRGVNYLNLDSGTRYRPLEPFGLNTDDINSSPLQICVDYAPLNSLCRSDMTSAGRTYNLAVSGAFDSQGFDSAGFDRLGYNRLGYNGDGFDKNGYDVQGYDRYGFDSSDMSKMGVTRTGETTRYYNPSVLDRQNFTRLGVDIRGIDFAGRDIFGYDSRGYDSDGCNGHYNDGYHYVKQKFELDLELSTISQRDLDKIRRLCQDIKQPEEWLFLISWVIIDRSHSLRGNRASVELSDPDRSSTAEEEDNLWIPSGPDRRFCIKVDLYSPCGLGKAYTKDYCDERDMCRSAECVSYGAEAKCRTVGCDNSCRVEWYHNGHVITPSCVGCLDTSSDQTYQEGDSWTEGDGCKRCQCVTGSVTCVGCQRVSCPYPDTSGCCPTCDGCTYEGEQYRNGAVFRSKLRPCDQCQCREGHVTCGTRSCPSLGVCRQSMTVEGACCPICLSCGNRRNGEEWNQDRCTVCRCTDGETRCTTTRCETPRCSHPVTSPGLCCPSCQACTYEGLYYKDGDKFTSADRCQSCECRRGNVTCSAPKCPDVDCDDPFRKPGSCCPTCSEGCEYSGEQYKDGAVFSPRFNPCMNCTCSNHRVRCGNVRCPSTTQELKCSRPIALPGDCCPSFCPTCVSEGVEYRHGDSWSPSTRPCDRCICYDGQISCRPNRRCDKICSYGVIETGSCCSPCTDCLLDGEIHRDGSSFSHQTQRGCADCTCNQGNIRCTSASQTCPPNDCANPIQIPNSCCSQCPGCSDGRSHGDRWRDEQNSCEICECRDERISCSRQPCPALESGCVSSQTPIDRCCPECTDCMTSSGDRIQDNTQFYHNDSCSDCSCQNRELTCERSSCPPLPDCNSPITLPGACCPTCADCMAVSGYKYRNGERFMSETDPCSECLCTVGEIDCIRQPCDQLSDCDTLVTPVGECCPICSDCLSSDGVKYRDGQEFISPEDQCTDCVCTMGDIRCLRRKCPPLSCDDPIMLPGKCCPSCVNKFCDYKGRGYQDSERFIDDCKDCSCRFGEVKCLPRKCPPLQCQGRVSQTGCCPECADGCIDDEGSLRAEGDEWRKPADSCQICVCQLGTHQCTSQQCPLFMLCSSPSYIPEGECCHKCGDCSHPRPVTIHQSIIGNAPLPSFTRLYIGNRAKRQLISLLAPNNPQTDEQNRPDIKDGSAACERERCPQSRPRSGQDEVCGNFYTPQGSCCPQCKDCARQVGYYPPTSVIGNNPLGDIPIPPPRPRRRGKRQTSYYTQYVADGGTYYNEETCEDCVCSRGSLTCTPSEECPQVECTHPRLDTCCPSCSGCQLGNITLRNYESAPHPEPELPAQCGEVCECTDGTLYCWRDCPLQPNCPRDAYKVTDECGCETCDLSSCLWNNVTHPSGSEWMTTSCETCRCQDGWVSCDDVTCPEEAGCDYPVTLTDDCCPSCNSGCSVDDVTYSEGEKVDRGDPCVTCYCNYGNLECSYWSCPVLLDGCMTKERNETECCEVCLDCVDTRPEPPQPSVIGNPPLGPGLIYQPLDTPRRLKRDAHQFILNGEGYYNEETCSDCVCDRGVVTCSPVSECPPTDCSAPRTDGCCPRCDGCDFTTGPLEYGQVVRMPDQPEVCQSTCMCLLSGEVSCNSVCSVVQSCDYDLSRDECGCDVCTKPSTCTSPSPDGVIYESGDQWTNDNNCDCMCESGEITCQSCDTSLLCEFTEPDATSCCGVKCKSCTVDQIRYSSGATWSHGGCRQLCSCHAGVVTCVELLLPDDHCTANPIETCRVIPGVVGTCCPGVTEACQCEAPSGDPLSIGDSFYPNITSISSAQPQCIVCTCVGMGSETPYLQCYEPVCPSVIGCPEDKLYYPESSSCCPLCRESVNHDCTADDEGSIEQGNYDPCVECTCTKGSWLCVSQTCPAIDCPSSELLTEPDQCCPTCAGCYTDNIKQAHGSSWQHLTDPCATCRCDYGSIKCEASVICPPLFCTEGRKAFTPEGECCQICGDSPTGDDCLDNRGRTRPHGSGWPIDDCTVCECLFGRVNCTSESCPSFECKSDETLVIEEGICCPSCVKQPALCKVYGDPHYKTFDGETIHYQGFCSYEMVSDCADDSFKIISIHDDRSTKSVSWIKGAIVLTDGLSVKFGQGMWAQVNDVNVSLPFQHSSGVVIRQNPANLILSSEKIGFKFTWDGAAYGEVEVETKLKNKLCGLCGNFNDNPSDELTLRDGTLVSSHAEFGDSWLVEGSDCTAVTVDTHPCEIAGYEVKKQAIEQCAIIQSELFSPCHRVVSPDDYVFSCVYDMCACNSTAADCLCDILTAYSSTCSNSYVRIQWRTPQLCAMNCDADRGFLFDECGPACPRTCENYQRPLGDLGKDCLRPCEPSCQCPAGLVQHNGRCIPTDLCPT